MQIHEVECKSALNKLKRRMPYKYDLNIYKGCSHGCIYCYAMYTHDFLHGLSFHEDIYVKENVVDILETELMKKSWKREIINIGGVTDSYQHIEKKYKIMPEILKLLIKYKTPCIISTKSDLILRDYDLIDELSRLTYVNVAASIVTIDEEIKRVIEPNTISSEKRFDMLNEFSKLEVSTGLHLMPIVPFLTDSKENIDLILEKSNDSKVDYVLPGMLYLKGSTRPYFLIKVKENYPEKYRRLLNLYKTGGADKEYKDKFYHMFNLLSEKYNINRSYSKIIKEKFERFEHKQLSLFD